MYKKDDLLQLPKRNSLIWRFMPLADLLAILQSRQLFFPSILTMADRFDGRLPASVSNRYWQWSGFERKDYVNARGSVGDRLAKLFRHGTFISCWHVNPVESAAMWSLYSSDHGIAVQSTVGRLIKAVAVSPAPISIGLVHYVDFAAPKTAERDLCFSPEFVKRKSFDYERELRAVIVDTEASRRRLPGIKVDVDVKHLIEAVYVSPKLQTWVKEVIERELQMHGSIDAPVRQSKLSSRDLK